ncbi:hypothetical protein V1508DRAFT_460003 [Lipomyces doorenjongii]|uniref:uncharacterized protein n=1 Tax=Lipomyces doorenjongii TaxID=383834 RepID=UPI0034CD6DFC
MWASSLVTEPQLQDRLTFVCLSKFGSSSFISIDPGLTDLVLGVRAELTWPRLPDGRVDVDARQTMPIFGNDRQCDFSVSSASWHVVCLDSLYKVRANIDAPRMSIRPISLLGRYHGNQLTACDGCIPDILTSSRKVIVMQHRIPESAISFYMDCMALAWGVDPVIRRKVLTPVVLHPMKVVTSYNGSNLLACTLVSTYVENFDNVQGRSTMPIVVFTTRADHAAQVLSILRNVAKDRFRAHAESRIKAVWAGIQGDGSTEVDVLVTTSVLQAGHSLDRYFRVSFDFLFLGVLSFREELQFISRLRYLGRNDMAEFKYGWIPDGKVGRESADDEGPLDDDDDEWGFDDDDDEEWDVVLGVV